MNFRNINFILSSILCLLFSATLLSAQSSEQTWPGKFFKGYTKSLTTGKFSYHSPQPDVKTSLLLRSIDSASFISWETEMVPLDFRESSAMFCWMFGIDANAESHTYKVFINGTYCLTFANPVKSEMNPWTIRGINGTSVLFRTTMLDKYDDPMGYAFMNIPRSLLALGKPQVIKIVGESAGSNVWYMTFESPVEEKLDIVQDEAIVRSGNKECYSLRLNFVHLGEPVNGRINLSTGDFTEFRLDPGFTSVQMLPRVTGDPGVKVATIKIGKDVSYKKEFRFHNVRHWTIYLVQHTHTDIGYTRPQTEILPEHLRYIDYALDYCDQTDRFPEEAQFRWTCETSWAVREYLATRPKSQVDRLLKRVTEGRIELTGLFLNSSDLADEASIASSLQPVRQFRNAGFTVQSAMQSDINGVPWCLTDYLSGCGIKYLSMGQNDSRALKPFDRPTTFWWESPSGKRILVNRPEHYMWGNQLGILTNGTTFGKALFLHLGDICEKGYPFDHYAIHFSGYLTDNSPPSTAACAMVEEWNRQYVWPKLRLSTVSEFMKYMETEHGKELQVIRGAWPDWWMDGFGSAALETAYSRMSHEDYIANQGLMSMAVMLKLEIPEKLKRDMEDISDDISFYDEHTFGAAESISDPLVENSIVQWNEKASYAWEAVKKNRILREEMMGLIQPYLPKDKEPTIFVMNTLNWSRSGEVLVYIDHQIIPASGNFRIIDETGKAIPVQRSASREEGTYWTLNVKDIPPLGYRTFRVKMEESVRLKGDKKIFENILENDFYRMKIDPERGTVVSLMDKQTNEELFDSNQKYQAGEFIYEELGKNRHQLEVLKLDDFRRTPWKDLAVTGTSEGALWKSITLHGQSPVCAGKDGVTCEIRLYNTEKKVGWLFSMKKMPVTDAEGVYVAFPFRLKEGKLEYETQGGTVRPGKDQIKGSATDWNGIQNFVSVRNERNQVVFVSPEIPLVQLGDINLGQFAREFKPSSNSIYSWVLNNYWTTNFRAYQEGELKWTYRITSGSDTTGQFACRFGWGERIPFLSRVFPGQQETSDLTPRTFLGESLKDLLLVEVKPVDDGNGIVLHLREINGKPLSVPVSQLLSETGAISVSEVDVLGEKVNNAGDSLIFLPYETRFLRIGLK